MVCCFMAIFMCPSLQLAVRGKNAKEKIGSLWKGLSKSVDESLVLRGQKDVDEWFDKEKVFLLEYSTK